MKPKKQLQVKYFFVDYEQSGRQKRIADAFDVIFDEIEEDMERTNDKNEYEQFRTA